MATQSEAVRRNLVGEYFAIAIVLLFNAVVFGSIAWLCYSGGIGAGVVLFATGGIVVGYVVSSVMWFEREFDFFSLVGITLLSACVITALLILTATDVSPVVVGGYGFQPHESTRLSDGVTALLEKQPSQALRNVRVFYMHAGHHARMYMRFTNGRVIRATLSPRIISRMKSKQFGFYVAENHGAWHVFVSHRDIESVPYSPSLAAVIVRRISTTLQWAAKHETERAATISSWHSRKRPPNHYFPASQKEQAYANTPPSNQ